MVNSSSGGSGGGSGGTSKPNTSNPNIYYSGGQLHVTGGGGGYSTGVYSGASAAAQFSALPQEIQAQVRETVQNQEALDAQQARTQSLDVAYQAALARSRQQANTPDSYHADVISPQDNQPVGGSMSGQPTPTQQQDPTQSWYDQWNRNMGTAGTSQEFRPQQQQQTTRPPTAIEDSSPMGQAPQAQPETRAEIEQVAQAQYNLSKAQSESDILKARLAGITDSLEQEEAKYKGRRGQGAASPQEIRTQSKRYDSLLTLRENLTTELEQKQAQVVASNQVIQGNIVTDAGKAFSGISATNPMTATTQALPVTMPTQNPTERAAAAGLEGTMMDPQNFGKDTEHILGKSLSDQIMERADPSQGFLTGSGYVRVGNNELVNVPTMTGDTNQFRVMNEISPTSEEGRTLQKIFADQAQTRLENEAQREYVARLRGGDVPIGEALFNPQTKNTYIIDGKKSDSLPDSSRALTEQYLTERGMSLETPIGAAKLSPTKYTQAREQARAAEANETGLGDLTIPSFIKEFESTPYVSPQQRIREMTEQATGGSAYPSVYPSEDVWELKPVGGITPLANFNEQTARKGTLSQANVIPAAPLIVPEAAAETGEQKDWFGGDIESIPDDPWAQIQKGSTAEAFNIQQAVTGLATGEEKQYAPTILGGTMEAFTTPFSGVKWDESGTLGGYVSNIGTFFSAAQSPEIQKGISEELGALGYQIQKYPYYYIASGAVEAASFAIPIGKVGTGLKITAQVTGKVSSGVRTVSDLSPSALKASGKQALEDVLTKNIKDKVTRESSDVIKVYESLQQDVMVGKRLVGDELVDVVAKGSDNMPKPTINISYSVKWDITKTGKAKPRIVTNEGQVIERIGDGQYLINLGVGQGKKGAGWAIVDVKAKQTAIVGQRFNPASKKVMSQLQVNPTTMQKPAQLGTMHWFDTTLLTRKIDPKYGKNPWYDKFASTARESETGVFRQDQLQTLKQIKRYQEQPVFGDVMTLKQTFPTRTLEMLKSDAGGMARMKDRFFTPFQRRLKPDRPTLSDIEVYKDPQIVPRTYSAFFRKPDWIPESAWLGGRVRVKKSPVYLFNEASANISKLLKEFNPLKSQVARTKAKTPWSKTFGDTKRPSGGKPSGAKPPTKPTDPDGGNLSRQGLQTKFDDPLGTTGQKEMAEMAKKVAREAEPPQSTYVPPVGGTYAMAGSGYDTPIMDYAPMDLTPMPLRPQMMEPEESITDVIGSIPNVFQDISTGLANVKPTQAEIPMTDVFAGQSQPSMLQTPQMLKSDQSQGLRQDQPLVQSPALATGQKQKQNVAQKTKLSAPAPLKLPSRPIRGTKPTLFNAPTGIVPPIPPFLEQQRKSRRKKKGKSSKKRKIIWAAPDVWFDAEGYYYKGGKEYKTGRRR